MKNIIVVTSLDINARNSAGSARILNIAKSLALSNVGVYLCSASASNNLQLERKREFSKNIYFIGDANKLVSNKLLKKIYEVYLYSAFILRINKLAKCFESKPVIYLYPTTKTSIDFFSLIYLKLIFRYKIYYEVNEVRLYSLTNRSFSNNPVKNLYLLSVYWVDYLKYVLVEKATSYYDGLLVISKNIEKYFSIYNKNIVRVPILSDTTANKLSLDGRRSYTNGDAFTICFTGMIELKKEGFNYLYEAVSIVKKKNIKIELHLYGPINKIDKDKLLTELPKELGIKGCIHYHGMVNQEVIINEMKKYHLLILPRPLTPQTSTGFSTKLSEYMVSGVPVLVTDVSDNSLYIKDNINGYIVRPGESKIMAEKLTYIIKNYEKENQEVARKAFDTAKSYFDYSNYSAILTRFLN